MTNTTYGAIKLSTADSVSRMLMKKLDSETGFKPSEWTDNINLLGVLPIRTASGTIAHFSDGADDVPMKSVVANIVPIQEGTGDPSPSNPRAIHGYTGLNIRRFGRNLLSAIPENNKLLSPSGTLSNNTSYGTTDLFFLKAGTYTASAKATATVKTATVRFRICSYQLDETFIEMSLNSYGAKTEGTTYSGSFTLANDSLVRFCGADDMTDFQLEVGSTATTYEPYTGSTYTINLGRTVYGGSAEVVEGEGEVTHGVVDLGDLTWTYRTDVLGVPCFLSSDISDIKSGTLPLACSCFKIMSPNRTAIDGNYQVSIGNNTNAKYLVIRYDEYTDGTAVKTALIGQKLVYELATPTDFTFEGEEINSYLGVNNVWTDSGEVLDVEYRADIDLLLASLEGNRGLQMMRATPTEENDEQEATENEGEKRKQSDSSN